MDLINAIETLEAALGELNGLLRSQLPSGPAALKGDHVKAIMAKVKLAQADLAARLDGVK